MKLGVAAGMSVLLLAGCGTSASGPADDRCTQALEYEQELVDDYEWKDGRRPEDYERNRLVLILANLYVGNPECFTPRKVANGQTVLDRQKTG